MSNLRVAVIQSDIVGNNKEQNYVNFAEKIQKIVHDVDLIVLPEMFNTGFITDMDVSISSEEEVSSWMYQQVKGSSAAIVGSAAIKTDSQLLANRLIFVTSDNDIYTYDKVHLFKHAGEHKKYVQGASRSIISYKGFRFLLTVCFDLRFPVFNCNNHDYDVMINVASWPNTRREHWKTLLKARAIENQAYVLACNRVGRDLARLNYSGDSSIIDYNGDVICESFNSESILFAKLDLLQQEEHRAKFSFLESQDDFVLNL